MTKKISKKDKLDAMLQMWNVLRAENFTRPFRTTSHDHKIMVSLQIELAGMLGVPTTTLKAIAVLLAREEVEVILSELDEVDGEIAGQLLHADGEIYEGNSRLNLLRSQLRKKLEAVPVPADFDKERYGKDLIKGEDVAEAPTSSENEELDEPATPQPEEEDEYKPEKDAEKKISEAREDELPSPESG